MNYIKNKVNCSYGSIMEKLYGKPSAQQLSLMHFSHSILWIFYVVSRIFHFILLFHKSTKSIPKRMNGGKIADQGCGMENFCGQMTDVNDEKIDESSLMWMS
jgi:hypothetical protein